MFDTAYSARIRHARHLSTSPGPAKPSHIHNKFHSFLVFPGVTGVSLVMLTYTDRRQFLSAHGFTVGHHCCGYLCVRLPGSIALDEDTAQDGLDCLQAGMPLPRQQCGKGVHVTRGDQLLEASIYEPSEQPSTSACIRSM